MLGGQTLCGACWLGVRTSWRPFVAGPLCAGADAAKGPHASATARAAPCAVITPGTLRDRKAFALGKWRSAALARAAFDLFLGDFPVDAAAKVQAAQAIVYVTNGFKCARGPPRPRPSGRTGAPACRAWCRRMCASKVGGPRLCGNQKRFTYGRAAGGLCPDTLTRLGGHTRARRLGPDPTNPNQFLLDTHGRAIDGLPNTQLGRHFAATPEGIEMAKPPPPSLADWAIERLESAAPLLDGLRRRLPFQGQAQRQAA